MIGSISISSFSCESKETINTEIIKLKREIFDLKNSEVFMSYNKTLKRLKSEEIKMDSLNKLLKEYDDSDGYTETIIEGHQILISSLKKRIANFEPIFNAINDSIKLIDDKIKVRENKINK